VKNAIAVGAIVTYVLPAGDFPRRTRFVEAKGDGQVETVMEFFDRCKQMIGDCYLLSIELKEVE
jgi:hypothetical protein